MDDNQLGVYRHYKGNLYKIVCFGTSTDTLEELVVYQALYGQQEVWVRAKEEFFGIKILDDGTALPRFTKVREN